MKELIAYLLENLEIDITGDLTLDKVRQFLREDDSRDARRLLKKLIDDEAGLDGMLIALADCLKEYIPNGITDDVVYEQIKTYAES